MTYRVFIEEAAVNAMAAARGPKRTKLREFISSLSSNPFDEGDFPEVDDSGRQTFTKLIEDFAISYYPDHAVNEVKVFQVVKADE